jgi:hypothetical protein
MNLGKLQKIAEDLEARVEALQPKQSPPALVFRYSSELNPNAPEDTEADPDGDDGEDAARDTLVMLPPGYRGPLREGWYTYAEYLEMAGQAKDGDSGVRIVEG